MNHKRERLVLVGLHGALFQLPGPLSVERLPTLSDLG